MLEAIVLWRECFQRDSWVLSATTVWHALPSRFSHQQSAFNIHVQLQSCQLYHFTRHYTISIQTTKGKCSFKSASQVIQILIIQTRTPERCIRYWSSERWPQLCILDLGYTLQYPQWCHVSDYRHFLSLHFYAEWCHSYKPIYIIFQNTHI